MSETYLDAIIERLPPERREEYIRLVHRFNVPADSITLASIYLQTAALEAILDAVKRERHHVQDAAADLPDAMRASGAEIVRGLGDEIAKATTASIKSDTVSMLQSAANIMAEHVGGLVEDVRQAAQDSTASVSADITAASSAMSQASAALAKSAAKLRGWSPQRIATAALGAILAAGMFAAGYAVHSADVMVGCRSRVERITRSLHLTPHSANAVQDYICKG